MFSERVVGEMITLSCYIYCSVVAGENIRRYLLSGDLVGNIRVIDCFVMVFWRKTTSVIVSIRPFVVMFIINKIRRSVLNEGKY